MIKDLKNNGLFWNPELKFLRKNWKNPKYFPDFFIHIFLYKEIKNLKVVFEDADFYLLTLKNYKRIFNKKNKFQLTKRHYEALNILLEKELLKYGEYIEDPLYELLELKNKI